MDLWLIAATAITKHLRNVSKSKEESSSCSEDFISVKVESPRCLASESVKPKEESFDDYLNGEKSFDLYGCGNAYGVEVDSSNDEIVSDWFRNRAFLRRNRRLIKPFSVKRSRLRVEEMSTEEYMCSSPFPSPCCSSVSRPLIVTDGTKVISKNVGDFVSQRVSKCGEIPRLRKLESSVLYAKRVVGESKQLSHRIGSNDAVLMLCVGISIGIMSSFVLKQTEAKQVETGLKLEDKDSSTVKDDLNNGDKQRDDEKAVEKSESISEIEAELEAELERLEINMSSSDIETRLPDDFELEPDFEVEFAQGELRDDQFKRQRFDETESNQEPGENSTPESGNYIVSPRELSLRLHEVITSRYEKRIQELEIALQESQRKVEQLAIESEEKTKPLSSLRGGTHQAAKYKRDTNLKHDPGEIQPLVMDLAGEALEAFNETYEELMDINDYSEEELSSLTSKSSPWSRKDEVKNPSRTSEDVNFFMLQDLLGLNEEEEELENENEMEKELIKQIVEKTKQGSSAVLNAQKMLFLMEETEQSL